MKQVLKKDIVERHSMGWGAKAGPSWARILLRILMEASPFNFPMLEECIQIFIDDVTNIHHFRNLLMVTLLFSEDTKVRAYFV